MNEQTDLEYSMSERITANSVRQSMVVASLTTEEVETYEKVIMAAANGGDTQVTLQCARNVHWSHGNFHMKQVESHFARQGFVCKLEPGYAARDQRDGAHLAILTVNWAEPSIGYGGVRND